MKDSEKFKTFGKSRSLRLKDFDYSQPYIAYHVTIGTFNQQPILSNPSISKKIVEVIKESRKIYGYQVIAYCIMPDHLHLLIQANEKCEDLRKFIGGLKSFSTKAVTSSLHGRRRLWQRGFYEHILKRDENILAIAEYILNNPVRKGLTRTRQEYKWKGLLDPPIK